MKNDRSGMDEQLDTRSMTGAMHRRKFLGALGIGVAASATLVACDKDDDDDN
ncbi:MAG: ferritin-like domain-containing protein, partial [Chryseobacterium sp.]